MPSSKSSVPPRSGGPLADVLAGDRQAAVLSGPHGRVPGRAPLPRSRGHRRVRHRGIKVKVRPIPHVGHTLGFRVEADGQVLAYLSTIRRRSTACSVGRQRARAVRRRRPAHPRCPVHRGGVRRPFRLGPLHCRLCRARGQRGRGQRLMLFHHDPAHSDDDIDRMLAGAQRGRRRRRPARGRARPPRDRRRPGQGSDR